MLNPGTRIYEYRLAKKISQADLADRAGLAQANLSNIENGKRDFTVSTLVRIAHALEVKPSMLIDTENISKPLKLNRSNINKLVKAVLDPKFKASKEIGNLADLIRAVIPEINQRISAKKIQLNWMRLKQRLSMQEINGICSRVREARQLHGS